MKIFILCHSIFKSLMVDFFHAFWRVQLLIIGLFFFGLQGLFAQELSGTITDEAGEPLAFVNVYVQGTSQGTSSNLDGRYKLPIPSGKQKISFQFIGYETQTIEITATTSSKINKDVVLKSQNYQMTELVISADAEDPAYKIIRNAQKMRKKYLSNATDFQCDVYIKGQQKLLDAPTEIMGQKLGDLGGALDSNRQGIVYLSESLSKWYVSKDNRKEEMISSKVSGSDRGYSFNSASQMDINFYNNSVELNRSIVSPIADNALGFYKYKLVGVNIGDAGRMINKIELTPKNKALPGFSGVIYIEDDTWRIQSVDLFVTKEATQITFVDSVFIKQQYLNVDKVAAGVLIGNTILFKMSGFGFKLRGVFSAVYSNYDFSPIPKKFFGKEVMIVGQEANTKSEDYWEQIRPLPLTSEEERDYEKKDSLKMVRQDPAYLDSVDRERNKFTFGNVLFGYTYRKSKEKWSLDLSSPLSKIQFNTVQGTTMELGAEFDKRFDEFWTKRLTINGNLEYGFAEKRLRGVLGVNYKLNSTSNTNFRIRAGEEVRQFQPDAISAFVNNIVSLLERKNFMKLFQRRFVEIGVRHDLSPSLTINASMEWAERTALVNNSDYSYFFRQTRQYTSNDIFFPFSENVPAWRTHTAQIAAINFTWRPGQKIIRYPHRVIKLDNQNPIFRLRARHAFQADGESNPFTSMELSSTWEKKMGAYGTFNFFAEYGSNVSRPGNIPVVDYFHFSGNQTFLGNPTRYTEQFLNMPYYAYSTTQDYLQVHLSHDFKGFLTDRIPGFNKLGLNMIWSYKLLYTGDALRHQEIALGFDKLGFGKFKIFRVDLVYGKSEVGDSWRFVVGVPL